ncbi:probable inactive receptor kinase RLK902 [Phragmites australis]|uniref:probable inactive receptor kinase RLK902 n=1 Tax=Phragmites australis TaxID=29695 RepID=UPI002D769132|nr:probable inactive receptor kinase RLK902 [Phragmites australis]
MRRPLDGVGAVLLVAALWCSALVPHAAPDLVADRAALLAFRAAVGPRLPWNASAASPCGWRGVRCDAAGPRVVALRLPGAGLSGQLLTGTVGNLTALRLLSLRLNSLSGEIPADIGSCAELRYLYFQGNQFSGEIPKGFFEIRLLQRLDLSNNRIAGEVSPEFNNLRRLATLYLENNSLNGTLPADLNLPKLQLFNVSNNNQLTGPVPASLARRPASAFGGTGLCGGPLSPCSNPPPPSPYPPPTPPLPPPSPPAAGNGSKSGKLSGGAIAGIAAGSVVAFLVLIAVIFFLCFRCQRTKADRSAEMTADVDVDGSPVSVTVASVHKSGPKRSRSSQTVAGNAKKLVFLGGAPDTPYDLESLLHASAEVIGKGWLGTTYRATLEGGTAVVAVKRLREAPIPEREFRDKAAALGVLRHENLAPLRAYFYSREEKLLVYDFVGAGSLCSLLHGNNGASPARLDFTARARISLAAARGVAFIHGAGSGSCHGNIKSSNVLVTDARDGAYVTDHGLVQLVGAHVPLKRVTGYRAPEVNDPRRASQEADVYSFGVVLLELLTGRPPANSVPMSDGVDLPQWVRTVVQEEWTAEVFDASIAVEERVEEDMMRLLQLATDCTDERPERRPAMAEVAARIEHIVESALRKADMDDDFHSISP